MKKNLLRLILCAAFLLIGSGKIFAQLIPNDECTGAVNITELNGYMEEYSTLKASLSMPACIGTPDSDIWFKFTANATRYQIIFSSRTYEQLVVQVFKGSCGNLTSILCYDRNIADINNLTVGETYYYRLYAKNASALPLNFRTSIRAVTAPANDEPQGAVPLTMNSDLNTNLGYALQSMPACFNTGNIAKDAWYKFVATETSHTVVLSPGTLDEELFEVFSGTPNNLTSIYCGGISGSEKLKSTTLTNLVVGNTYYIRVYNSYGEASPSMIFNLSVKTVGQTLANDECTGAIDVGKYFNESYTNLGATLSMPACAGSPANDIWFKFTASSSRYRIISNTIKDEPIIMQLFKGSCGNLVPMLCFEGYYADVPNLVPGQTYYYRLYLKSASTDPSIFRTQLSTVESPAHDEPAGAITLNLNTTLLSNVGYATQTLAPCSSSANPAKDAWYKFTATADKHDVTINTGSNAGIAFQFFSGPITKLVSIYCDGSYQIIKTAQLTKLTIGSVYYFRVYSLDGDASPSVGYSLKLTNAGVVPENDECTGAIEANEYWGASVSNQGATLSMPGCSGTPKDDIWFKFMAKSNRYQIRSSTGGYETVVTQLFKGQCGSLISILCDEGNNIDVKNLVPGETYYYRLYVKNGPIAPSNFTSMVQSVPLPINDEVEGAIPVVLNNMLNTTLGYASQSRPACYNTGYGARDVWYKFVATGTVNDIYINPLNFDEQMFEVFKGTLSNLTSIYCSGTLGFEKIKIGSVPFLTIGETYYIRVYGRYGNADPSVIFAIGIATTPVPTPVIIAGGPTTFDYGLNVALTLQSARPGYTYQWIKNGVDIVGANSETYLATVNGSYSVRATYNSITLTASPIVITVIPVPKINSFTPTTAVAGTLVTILGENFGTVSKVSFGGVDATSFTVISETQITATLGNGKSGEILLTNASGIGKRAGFSFVPQPVITADGPTTFAIGNIVTLNVNPGAGYTYKWYKDNILISGSTANNFYAYASGNYHASITLNGVTTISNAIPVKVIFTLPSTNFWVQATAETCKTSNNGSIIVTAGSGYTYNITVVGNNKSISKAFYTMVEFPNLSAGLYSVCITVSGQQDYKQCYDVNITEPKDLSVYTLFNPERNEVNLTMSGADTYTVALNGKIFTVNGSTINLPLANGINEVTVTTGKECQGIFKQSFNVRETLVYPNPFNDVLTIASLLKTADVSISDTNGRIVYQAIKEINGTIELNLNQLPAGFYILKIKGTGSETYHKIIKK